LEKDVKEAEPLWAQSSMMGRVTSSLTGIHGMNFEAHEGIPRVHVSGRQLTSRLATALRTEEAVKDEIC
jgi:hypothetical protein